MSNMRWSKSGSSSRKRMGADSTAKGEADNQELFLLKHSLEMFFSALRSCLSPSSEALGQALAMFVLVHVLI